MEELTWQLPFGPDTEALFHKPSSAQGKLPGILTLHDHAGNKFRGYRKNARGKDNPHKEYYDSLCWANEIIKLGMER